MKYCYKCGKELPDDASFCTACGADQNGKNSSENEYQYEQQEESSGEANISPDGFQAPADPQDIQQNRILALLSYLGWLVVIPIFAARDSRFTRFHANQGLVLLLSEVIYRIAQKVLLWLLRVVVPFGIFASKSIAYYIASFATQVIWLVFVGMIIFGIYNTVQGKMEELPVIGHIRLIKN